MLVLYLLPGAASQLAFPVAGLAWTQVFAFLLPAFLFASASGLDPRRALLLERAPPRGAVAAGLLVGAVGFVVAGSTMALVSGIMPATWVRTFDLTPLFRGPPGERYALGAIAALLAPVCEEVAFRGHVLSVLRARLRPGGAIALTATLFALLHLDPVRFLAVLLLGLVFGWLAWRAGSVWPAVAAHAVNNGIGALLVTSSAATDGIRAGERPDPFAALAALAFGVALLAPVLSLYRRLTPHPPPAEDALLAADPADDDPRLRLHRVPRAQLRLAAAGVALLGAIAAAWLLTR
jgi:membrane protease YdiL (CAAX protease family)